MITYSIYKADGVYREHLEEICLDIADQVKNGVIDCPLFMVQLMPKGNPIIDVAENIKDDIFAFCKKLHTMGLPCGILVQTTLGHAYMNIEKNGPPFSRYVNLTDGKESVFCPYDKGFQGYFEDQMYTLASIGVDAIMIDDDFRLMSYRSGLACACENHLKRYNELASSNITREELYALIKSGDKKARDILVETQKESLLEATAAMRRGIDKANPKIQGSACCCGDNAEFIADIAKIIAGEGNPVIVRINNGSYSNTDMKNICSKASFRAACQINKIKGRVDYVLAETDTCPHHRYATGAQSLHTHFILSLLEGVNGAKQWITKLNNYEPESGEKYRKVLKRYSGMYHALEKMYPDLEWLGAKIPLSEKSVFFDNKDYSDAWFSKALGRLGIPICFGSADGGINFLDSFRTEDFTAQEIKKMLSGTLFVTVSGAQKLCELGYGEYLGVKIGEEIPEGFLDVREWIVPEAQPCQVQIGSRILIPTDNTVKIDSYICDYDLKGKLYPAVTVYKNSLGGNVIVFAGTLEGAFNHSQGFAFLNRHRKLQLVRLIKEYGNLPIYATEEYDLFVKAAKMKNGGILCAVVNTCTDIVEELELVSDRDIKKAEVLTPDGKHKEITFTKKGQKLILDLDVPPMQPQILFLY